MSYLAEPFEPRVTVRVATDHYGTACFRVMVDGQAWMDVLYENMARAIAERCYAELRAGHILFKRITD